MTIEQIINESIQLKTLSDKDAYTKGLKLLKELKKYRVELSRNQYKAIENRIQEQRFRIE